MTNSQSFITFQDMLDKWDDDYYMPLVRMVNDFCELPSDDTLKELNKLIPETMKSAEFMAKNMARYSYSSFCDMSEEERKIIVQALEDLYQNIQYEIASVEDVIENELFNAAYFIDQAQKEILSTT